MKLNEAPQLPDGPYRWPTLIELLRQTAKKVNALSAGAAVAYENTGTAAPTTGTWAQGDFFGNSSKTELGLATAKYVIQGWDCVVGGTPGTWVQRRTLTGN
jgi:hypothetical protein